MGRTCLAQRPSAVTSVQCGCGCRAEQVEPGLYACGWVKRGPTGIIGTNASDAEETVASIVQDANAGRLLGDRADPAHEPPGPSVIGGGAALQRLLEGRRVRAVDFAGWQRIDAHELQAGQAAGKAREKVVDVDEMLRIAARASELLEGL